VKRAYALALVAAALFGASAPIAKLLVGASGPLVVAGLLYLGAGLALSPFALARRGEARVGRRDLPLVAGVVLAGGVVGPVLLLYGLAHASGAVSSLLLNLETVFTTLLAVTLFGESIGRRGVVALACIVGGAAALTFEGGPATVTLLGPLAVVGAALAWGVDNNLTERLSLRDPYAVVRWKGLCAGPISLAIGVAAGEALPPLRLAAAALAVGAVGYGASLVLYVRAQRALGAARTGVLFAVGPFVGAIVAVPLLHERPSVATFAAGAAMALGVALLVGERHEHPHTHEAIEHEHLHAHDEHHQHAHDAPAGAEPHSHVHRHEPLTHTHRHASDRHHRHKH
jgi:drug/metabolite transporter (DMT)-like permease